MRHFQPPVALAGFPLSSLPVLCLTFYSSATQLLWLLAFLAASCFLAFASALPFIPLFPFSWLGHPHLLKQSILALTHSSTNIYYCLLSARSDCWALSPAIPVPSTPCGCSFGFRFRAVQWCKAQALDPTDMLSISLSFNFCIHEMGNPSEGGCKP